MNENKTEVDFDLIPRGGYGLKYDRNGGIIGSHIWGLFAGNPDYRRVAFEQISKEVEVSTVWLGLDHQFIPGGPILIFETMIFGGERDGDMMRYSTEAQAEAGHAKIVRALKRAMTKKQKRVKRGRK